jgi:DNA-binding response OmpR family regulator
MFATGDVCSLPLLRWAMCRIRVLLVEDDDRLATFPREFLEHNGLEVVHSADGEAAVREAEQGAFDVMVLDILLPSLDGYAVVVQRRSCSTM